MAEKTPTKKPRTCLANSEKVKVIEELKSGTCKPVKEVAVKFGISKNQVYKIFKHKTEIQNAFKFS